MHMRWGPLACHLHGWKNAVRAILQAGSQDAVSERDLSRQPLQVYAFGPVSITMDAAQNVIKASVGDRWLPVSLEQLVEAAAHKPKRR